MWEGNRILPLIIPANQHYQSVSVEAMVGASLTREEPEAFAISGGFDATLPGHLKGACPGARYQT